MDIGDGVDCLLGAESETSIKAYVWFRLATYDLHEKTVYAGVCRGDVGGGEQWMIPATDWASFTTQDKVLIRVCVWSP
jgi:hypothetical protein